MPKIKKQPDPVIKMAMSEWKEFEDPNAWKRSKRGNLWRNWLGMTLTIFKRDDGYFGWCIVDSEEKQFSPGGFESEEDAMSSAGGAIGIGVF